MDGSMFNHLGAGIAVSLVIAAILGGCGVLGVQCVARHVHVNVEMVR